MKSLSILFALTLLTIATGCVRVRSNVKDNATPPFKRILVVTKTEQPSDAFTNQFLKAFPANYEVCTIGLKQLPFENHEEAIRKQADLCNSDAILTIETVYRLNPWSFRDDARTNTFTGEMRLRGSNQPFWKSAISANWLYGENFPARSVVRQLLKDGILTGELPRNELQALN